MARAALAFILGACCAYVLMAERRKPEPTVRIGRIERRPGLNLDGYWRDLERVDSV